MDSSHLAAFHLLGAPMLEEATSKYVKTVDNQLSFDWQGIFGARFWSSGEQILIDMAYQLFTGRDYRYGFADEDDEKIPLSSIGDAIRTLDDANWKRLLQAFEMKRGAR